MGRERARGKPSDPSVLGHIVFSATKYHNEIVWEFWKGENAFTEDAVVNIRTAYADAQGNTFTYPGLTKPQAREAIKILEKFISEEAYNE